MHHMTNVNDSMWSSIDCIGHMTNTIAKYIGHMTNTIEKIIGHMTNNIGQCIGHMTNILASVVVT